MNFLFSKLKGLEIITCSCKLNIFSGLNLIPVVPFFCAFFSRVMCFHPWSDVTLPIMSIDEILEVIREWIRQYQDLSKTYRWIQVIIIWRIAEIFVKSINKTT